MHATSIECICCHEVDSIIKKMYMYESELSCITEHEGFEAVCLNLWVIQAAYFNYQQHYGNDVQHRPVHE